ncbi:SDR family oxidoreductase [Patescibacteria group bacterium]|nr:SDR family oxidoreductase [Patescibacteria group bacterium]
MDRKAVVTGSSSGIGNSIAKKLLNDGWEVWGISRTETKNLVGNSRFHQITFDLSATSEIKTMTEKLPEKINLLINNAGLWELVLLKDITLKHLDRTINLNLKAPIYLTSLLLPRLLSGSLVINISSIMSQYTESEYGVYAATKAGIDRFTTTLAKEKEDLKVLAILPSATDTPANRNVLGKSEDYSKYLTPDQIADIAMRAVSGEFSSGDLIVVNNTNFLGMWEEKDKYQIINVDKS